MTNGSSSEPRGSPGDGRNVDPRIGLLEGEAADQRVPERRATAEGGAPAEVWPAVPGEAGAPGVGDATYFDRPAIKEPVWIWSVPAYFYVGGAAGAAAVLAGAAQAVDRDGLDGLIERCRWIGAVGGAVGTGLLVQDLGRPERFLNMLRVFRPTSPLSVGSWVLAAAAPLMAGSAVLARSEGPGRRLGDLAGLGAALLGLPLAGYTAVLLSNTAVPVWQHTRRSLPPLFVSSGMASAADLLALTGLGAREEAVVHRFGVAGKAAELASTAAMHLEASRAGRAARPLRRGPTGALLSAATGLTAASLLLSWWPGRPRWARLAAAATGTAGSVALKFGVVKAGWPSARDPRDTFQPQRAGLGGKEATGTVAVTGPGGHRGAFEG